MNFATKLLLLLASLMVLTAGAVVFSHSTSLAQDQCPTYHDPKDENWDQCDLKEDPANLQDPVSARNLLSGVISMGINILLIAGAFAAFGMFIFGAFRYMTAKDDPAKTKKARDTMQYAIVGLIIMSMVYVFLVIYNNILPSA